MCKGNKSLGNSNETKRNKSTHTFCVLKHKWSHSLKFICETEEEEENAVWKEWSHNWITFSSFNLIVRKWAKIFHSLLLGKTSSKLCIHSGLFAQSVVCLFFGCGFIKKQHKIHWLVDSCQIHGEFSTRMISIHWLSIARQLSNSHNYYNQQKP